MAKERRKNSEIVRVNEIMKEIGDVPLSEFKEDPNLCELAKCRIDEFHNACTEYEIKPTIEGLALCMGVSRQVLTAWYNGEEPWVKETHLHDVISHEWSFINACHVTGMEEGTIDRVVGIFVGKNNFGYRNEDQEVKPQQIQISFSASQLIEEAKNLQLQKK